MTRLRLIAWLRRKLLTYGYRTWTAHELTLVQYKSGSVH